MNINEQMVRLLEQIMNSREGCCGTHHIYTPQLNVDHIKDLYKQIKQPSNTQMQIDTRACDINHKELRDIMRFEFCHMCGSPLND